MADDSGVVVPLWCGTCRAFVPITAADVTRPRSGGPVLRVTPDCWREHRATHDDERNDQ